jgi:flagellar assembly factor FliW
MNAAAAALQVPEEVPVNSALLGTLSLPISQIFAFPRGIQGFPEARSFALLPARQIGLFWLQSLDFEALTFLLLDPFPTVQGYVVELAPSALGASRAPSPESLLVLTIVTLPREPGQAATANLQGPLVFDLEHRTGHQVVLQDAPWGVRHPVQVGGARRA